MIPRVRMVLFALSALGLVVLAIPTFTAWPAFGAIDGLLGDRLVDLVITQRQAANTVTGILFDVRAIDTLGEEFILFAAVSGTVLLLRTRRDEEERPELEPRSPGTAGASPALRALGAPLIGLTTLLGLSLVAHGHLGPGGGFQGGVMLAGGLLLFVLLHDEAAFDRVAAPARLVPVESLGLGGYLVVGLAGVAAGTAFLDNVLPLGRIGELFSAGTIPVLDALAGLAVVAGFGVLIAEFVEQAIRIRESIPPRGEGEE